MKVLHTSDWHFGRKFLARDMHEHQEEFVEWLITEAAGQGVELVVIAGDIFDRSVPPQESITLFERALVGLSSVCPVFVIPGNHDSAVRLGYGGTFFESNGVHIRSETAKIDQPVHIKAADSTELVVYGIPYLHPDIHSAEFGVSRSHSAVLNHAMERICGDLEGKGDVRSMVVSHAFITGGAQSESERDLEIGGIGDAPGSIFSGIDYIAMGHLHGAQEVASETGIIRYSGSPLPYSFSEERHLKSVTLIDIPANGKITTTLIPVPQPAPLVTIEGTMEYLETEPSLSEHVDSWVRCKITDRRRPENPMKRLSARFNHVLKLEFDPDLSQLDSEERGPRPRLDPQKVPRIDLVSEFFAEVTHSPMTETERSLMAAAIESVNSAGVES